MPATRKRGAPVKAKKAAAHKSKATLRAKQAGVKAARAEYKRANNKFMQPSTEKRAKGGAASQKSIDTAKAYVRAGPELSAAKKRVVKEKAKLKNKPKSKSTGGRNTKRKK